MPLMIHPILTPAEKTFSDHIIAHLRAFARSIDVTRFVNLYRWDNLRIMDLYMNVLWNTPEVFYVTNRIRDEKTVFADGRVKSARLTGIQYSIHPSEFDSCWKQLKQEVLRALNTVRGISAPELIALRLHDHLVRICEYDCHAAQHSECSAAARSAYSVLIRHKAVCEGYTMAYRLLLNAAGILSEEIISDEMNHCWNYVYLRGHWYHVDVTYDDPVWIQHSGADGNLRKMIPTPTDAPISHENFLISDRRARQTGHFGWSTRGLPPADNTAFDGHRWGG